MTCVVTQNPACSAAWMNVTWEWCCSWHRRWRGGRPFDGSERLAFIGPLLPHLCPPRLLSLSYLSAGSSRKSSPLAVCVRRQVCEGQSTQGRDYFIQLRQFLPCLSTFSLQRLSPPVLWSCCIAVLSSSLRYWGVSCGCLTSVPEQTASMFPH